MAETHSSADPPDGAPAVKTFSRSSGDKRHGGPGMISRLFSRQVGSLKESRSQDISARSNISQDNLMSVNSETFIGPCPFIRPLGHKLVARQETSGLPSPYHRSHCGGAMMCDVETFCSMSDDGSESPGLSPALLSWMTEDALKATLKGDYFESDFDEKSGVVDKNAIKARFIQQVREIADSSAKNLFAKKHWKFYLICYSKGQFNMISPPEPPPRRTDFHYLPSIFPRDEVRRLVASHSFDVVWPEWTQEKSGTLITAAMKRFGTKFAALSFFDCDHELFKAENGYKWSKIERHISIAAHALLSADVLVIVDTTKDWRFHKNPLVTTEPHVRFFAGAPMLASNGQAVGVLSVFDVVPRPEFDPFDRRALTQFGALAMEDLELQAKRLAEPDWCSTPLLDQNSTVGDESLARKLESLCLTVPSNGTEADLVPPALRFHKSKTPPRQHSRVFISEDLQNNIGSSLSQTPPSSSESENARFMGTCGTYGRGRQKLPSVKYSISDDPLTTLDSSAFRMPTPRPFSSSDITSLHLDPPNTPTRSMDGRKEEVQLPIDLTFENFMSLSDGDCAEQASPATIPERNFKNISTKGSSPVRKPAHASLPQQSRRKGHSIMAEAAISCAFSAKSLGYDLIYVAEFKPKRPFMTDEQLIAPGGLQPRVLCAHNLKDTLKLDPNVHLEVLRMRGFKSWESHQDHYERGEFQSGFMVAIHTEGGPLHKRSRGVIFGAYRKPRYDGNLPGTTSASDTEKLGEAAEAVKNILFKRRQGPKRSNTEPASGFPANEARETGGVPGSQYRDHTSEGPLHEDLQYQLLSEVLRPVKYSPREGPHQFRGTDPLGMRTFIHE